MSLRRKIMCSVGVLFAGLLLLVCFWGEPVLSVTGGFIAIDGLVLHRLWYRCPGCGGRLDWSARWTYCPHCGAWIDYDKTD